MMAPMQAAAPGNSARSDILGRNIPQATFLTRFDIRSIFSWFWQNRPSARVESRCLRRFQGRLWLRAVRRIRCWDELAKSRFSTLYGYGPGPTGRAFPIMTKDCFRGVVPGDQ